MMISIKKFLEQRADASRTENDPPADQDLIRASLQTIRLLLEAVPLHAVRGRDADFKAFGRTFKNLARALDQPPSAISLLGIASDATESLEEYSQRTAGFLRELNEQMQSIVAMLTETLADVSGQADDSVARLQSIERQIEQASGLDDIRTLSSSLETCLTSLRDAVAQQRKGTAATVQRLREQISMARKQTGPPPVRPGIARDEIDLLPESPEIEPEATAEAYVAVFKLKRAQHIESRYGESAKHQMLSLISRSLKTMLGPTDRLLRWKGMSFVLFLSSTKTLAEMQARLSQAVAAVGRQYVEVGKKTALLSVGVDWTVFPQSRCASLDAVFTEVEAFLAVEAPVNPVPPREAARHEVSSIPLGRGV